MPSEPQDGLDPEIRRFVQLMGEAWREHPALDSVPLPEARRIADNVRRRFAVGGPQMAQTSEFHVPHAQGTVRVRVYEPQGGDAQGALVYLHGGGWVLFNIDTHDRIMREYAARARVTVVGVDYSLAPEARFPRAIDETIAVIHWLQDEGANLGVDRNRIAVGGDSAGAATTVGVCLKLRDAGEPNAVRAMLLNYGCFDTACASPSFQRYVNGGYMWEPGEMQVYWQHYLGEASPVNPLAASIHADVRGLPPAFLTIPECDVLYDENIAMAEKLRQAGVPTQAVIYPGATHSFLEAISMARVSDRAFADSSGWLAATLR